jgi:hypothetical protein
VVVPALPRVAAAGRVADARHIPCYPRITAGDKNLSG